MISFFFRHPGEGRDPESRARRLPLWVPAFAGMTMLSLAAPALADSRLPPQELAYTQLPDPKQEARAKELMESLRCLVCQGQSIADSDAEMAGNMRAEVREQVRDGKSPEAIRGWLVERYGDYVTYDPPFSWLTAPLWATPILLIAIGLFIARRSFGKEEEAE
jgi:cytochrome c-type biogenesis protein CcmH